MVSHHHYMFHPSQYGITTSPYVSPILILPFHIYLYGIILPFYISLYGITASSFTSIVESCCHPILSGWHQQYHILPHHYRESHPAPLLQGITSCPIITGIIHHSIGSDKLFQFTRETTIVHTLTRKSSS
jgi:hypothetical protein